MKNEAMALAFTLPLIQTVWFRFKFSESIRLFWGLLSGYALIAFLPVSFSLYGFLAVTLLLELFSQAVGKQAGKKGEVVFFYRLSFVFACALHYFSGREITEDLLRSAFSAVLFPVLTAFYERLRIEKAPSAIEGLPLFLFLCGLLLLFFSGFLLFGS